MRGVEVEAVTCPAIDGIIKEAERPQSFTKPTTMSATERFPRRWR
jgi:hypothetical protein